MINVAVIGGSGVYNLDDFEKIQELNMDTPFGKPSAPILEIRSKKGGIQSHSFYFLPRHGHGHTISPSEINYRANIWALKKLGVKILLSFSAVGSLHEHIPPGMFVLPDQFIDATKGLRKRSFYDDGMVGHISCADPVSLELQNCLFAIIKDLKLQVHQDGAYVCIEGPQFSSRAESEMYRKWGATIIGMTNVPEAYLAKEARMQYASICMVTDYDCIKEKHCTLEEIMNVMKNNYINAQMVLEKLIPKIYETDFQFKNLVEGGLVTSKEKLSSKHLDILKVIEG